MTLGDQDCSSSNFSDNRRSYARVKARVPVEIRSGSNQAPIRGETSDLSLGGLYIEMMFTLPVGTQVEISLNINRSVQAKGTVVTRHPNFGNGIQFTAMNANDQEALKAFIEARRLESEQ